MADKKEEKKFSEDDTVTINTSEVNGKKNIDVGVKKGGKKKKLKELELEIDELKNELLKNRADLENFKKRMKKEQIQDRKYAAMDLIHDLLIPIDQLDKIVGLDVDDPKLKNYLVGFKMVNDQIFQVLNDYGVKYIESVGEKFDPKYHHAEEVVCDETKEDGIVTEEIQKGYMYKERLIRPSLVKVNDLNKDEKESKNKE